MLVFLVLFMIMIYFFSVREILHFLNQLYYQTILHCPRYLLQLLLNFIILCGSPILVLIWYLKTVCLILTLLFNFHEIHSQMLEANFILNHCLNHYLQYFYDNIYSQIFDFQILLWLYLVCYTMLQRFLSFLFVLSGRFFALFLFRPSIWFLSSFIFNFATLMAIDPFINFK